MATCADGNFVMSDFMKSVERKLVGKPKTEFSFLKGKEILNWRLDLGSVGQTWEDIVVWQEGWIPFLRPVLL